MFGWEQINSDAPIDVAPVGTFSIPKECPT